MDWRLSQTPPLDFLTIFWFSKPILSLSHHHLGEDFLSVSKSWNRNHRQRPWAFLLDLSLFLSVYLGSFNLFMLFHQLPWQLFKFWTSYLRTYIRSREEDWKEKVTYLLTIVVMGKYCRESYSFHSYISWILSILLYN